MAYSLQSLLDELTPKLEGHDRYTTALKISALNRAREDIFLFASVDASIVETTPPADPNNPSRFLAEIELPPNLLTLNSVAFDGERLRRLTHQGYVNAGGDTLDRTGPPFIGYTMRSKGQKRFLELLPRPGESKTIQIYFLELPDDFTEQDLDADPGIDRWYTDAMIQYACFWLKNGIAGEEKSSLAHYNLYLSLRADARFNADRGVLYRIQQKGA